MSTSFRPAVFEPPRLLIGIAGSSHSGKTWSAMRLATGMTGGNRFAVIDTENSRALMYARDFNFDHARIREPFTPEAYMDKLTAAVREGYSVIVVDSFSHSWNGIGGVLDAQEAELDRRQKSGDDAKQRERRFFASWAVAKRPYKRMLGQLSQLNANIILCFRAEPKTEMVRGANNQWVIRPKQSLIGIDGWMPITDSLVPYELTASVMLFPGKLGIPRHIKVIPALRPFFPEDRQISEEAGKGLANWAIGDKKPEPKAEQPLGFPATCITADQARQIEEYAESLDVNLEGFNTWLMKEWSSRKVSELPAHAFGAVIETLQKKELGRQGRD